MIKARAGDPGSVFTTVLEFLFSIIVCVCGLTVNYIFMRKLEEEKRNVPLGRKGNVIEPIMRWFLKFQMIYWPYHLTFFWMIHENHIIPSDNMTGWWCNVIAQIGIKFGRLIIAYNSTFIALVRYLYIVHHNRVDKWNYEKVRKWFGLFKCSCSNCNGKCWSYHFSIYGIYRLGDIYRVYVRVSRR